MEQKDFGLSDPEALSLFGGWPTGTGGYLGESKAMRNTTVRACVVALTNTLSILPRHVFERQDDGGRERASEHPAERIIAGYAAPWLPFSEFVREATYRALFDGVAYASVVRVRGEPRELIPIPFSAVTRKTNDLTGEPSYVVKMSDGRDQVLPWQDVFELRMLNGRSPIRDASKAISIANQLEDHVEKLFSNSARPSGYIKLKGKLGTDSAKRLKASFESSFGGSNQGRTAVFEEDTSYETVGMTSVDSEHLANRRFQVAEICRAMGVPAVLVNDLERAVWKNIEELGQQFLTYVILPMTQIWQDALTRVLITTEDRAKNYIEFSTDSLVRADLAARMQAYALAITNGVLSRNEARAKESLPAKDGLDEMLSPLNMRQGAVTNQEGGTDGA